MRREGSLVWDDLPKTVLLLDDQARDGGLADQHGVVQHLWDTGLSCFSCIQARISLNSSSGTSALKYKMPSMPGDTISTTTPCFFLYCTLSRGKPRSHHLPLMSADYQGGQPTAVDIAAADKHSTTLHSTTTSHSTTHTAQHHTTLHHTTSTKRPIIPTSANT
jgi:hypothetical protein